MTASEALGYALGQRLQSDEVWRATSRGFFYQQARTGTDLPYTTYVISSITPVGVMQGTSWWRIRVQMKHWCDSGNMAFNAELAQRLSNAAGRLFHCRNDDGYGSNIRSLDELNGLELNGWQFLNGEIVKEIPMIADQVGDKGEVAVWTLGHDFLFELQRA